MDPNLNVGFDAIHEEVKKSKSTVPPRAAVAASGSSERLAQIDRYEADGRQSPYHQQRVVSMVAAELLRSSSVTGPAMTKALSALDPESLDSVKRADAVVRRHLSLVRQFERLLQVDLKYKELRLKSSLVSRRNEAHAMLPPKFYCRQLNDSANDSPDSLLADVDPNASAGGENAGS